MQEFLKKVDQKLKEKGQRKEEDREELKKRYTLFKELITRAEEANRCIDLTVETEGIGNEKIRISPVMVAIWAKREGSEGLGKWDCIISLNEKERKEREDAIQYFTYPQNGTIGRVLQGALDGKASVEVESDR